MGAGTNGKGVTVPAVFWVFVQLEETCWCFSSSLMDFLGIVLFLCYYRIFLCFQAAVYHTNEEGKLKMEQLVKSLIFRSPAHRKLVRSLLTKWLYIMTKKGLGRWHFSAVMDLNSLLQISAAKCKLTIKWNSSQKHNYKSQVAKHAGTHMYNFRLELQFLLIIDHNKLHPKRYTYLEVEISLFLHTPTHLHNCRRENKYTKHTLCIWTYMHPWRQLLLAMKHQTMRSAVILVYAFSWVPQNGSYKKSHMFITVAQRLFPMCAEHCLEQTTLISATAVQESNI